MPKINVKVDVNEKILESIKCKLAAGDTLSKEDILKAINISIDLPDKENLVDE